MVNHDTALHCTLQILFLLMKPVADPDGFQGVYDKICRERDQLKETVKNFEKELIQVRLEIYTSCTMYTLYSYCLHACNYIYSITKSI